MLKAALRTLIVMWGAITLLFAVFFVLPGDRVDEVIGGSRIVSAEVRQATSEKLGLDEPIAVQYVSYMNRLVHGDLGTSFVTGRSVTDVLSQTVPASLRLAFWVVVIEVLIGIAIGVLAAVTKRTFVKVAVQFSTFVFLSFPVFVLGYLLQIAFGVFPFEHNWPEWAHFPTQGIGPDSWVLGVIPTGEQWRYLLLPVLTLSLVSTAVVIRMMRSSMLEQMSRDYIRGARAKGLSEGDVVVRHALRNALSPVVTFIGLDLVNLFGAAVVTETVFNWPGVGSQIALALSRQDAPVVLGLVIVLVIAYSAMHIVVDFIHRYLDPRIKAAT